MPAHITKMGLQDRRTVLISHINNAALLCLTFVVCAAGPTWPNSSSHLVPLTHNRRCGRTPAHGCLFDLQQVLFNAPPNLACKRTDKPCHTVFALT